MVIVLTLCASQAEKKSDGENAKHGTAMRNPQLSQFFYDICKFPMVLHNIIFDMLHLEFRYRAIIKKAHKKRVCSLALLSDGHLASLSELAIKTWDINACACLNTLLQERYFGGSLTALSDNRVLTYSGYCKKPLVIHNLHSGSAQEILPPLGIRTLVALPKNRIAYCEMYSTAIRVCKIRSWWQFLHPPLKEIRTLIDHDEHVCILATLPNNCLASGSEDTTIKIWNTKSGLCLKTLQGHAARIMACVPLLDGRLASYDARRVIKIWNIAEASCLRTIPAMPGCDSPLAYIKAYGFQVVFNKYLLALYQEQAKLWDPLSGECLQTFNINDTICGRESRFIVRDNQLIIGNDEGDILVYEAS